jgi:ferrochelatase
VADCRRTFDALLARLGWPPGRATLAFQSRFGPARWLEPPTAKVLEALARSGLRRVVVSAPGFLTDGLETLEELGVRGRETFRAAGGEELALAAAPAGHPALSAALAELAAPSGTAAGSRAP